MSISDFFTPISRQYITQDTEFSRAHLGSLIDIYEDRFPDLEDQKPDLVIFGVKDDRMAIDNTGAIGVDIVRKHLYSLYSGDYQLKMADLGNIQAGETVKDTYVALRIVVEELLKQDIIPIIIGGGQDLTYAQYTGYEKLERKVEVAVVDARFDLDQENTEDAPLNSQTFLNHIILHQPDYLFNLNNLAYQTYYASKESIEMYDKLYFTAVRLGLIAGKMEQAEPIIRAADMLSFDISAIRFSDAPGSNHAGPNGLFGQEACQICRYAGMSDKLTSIGFYEYNPTADNREQTAILLAQMVWYFVDGYYNRKHDAPPLPKSSYITYRITLEDDDLELVFIKSKKSDRWWMQVPYFGTKSVNERYYLAPCSYDDYLQAVSGEMPDLWWKTHRKLH